MPSDLVLINLWNSEFVKSGKDWHRSDSWLRVHLSKDMTLTNSKDL